MRSVALASGAMIAATLCLITPAAIYFGNSEDFPYRFTSYLPVLIAAAAVVAVAVAALTWIVPWRWRLPWAAFICFLAVMSAVESYLILPDFGTLTGAAPDFARVWSRIPPEITSAMVAGLLIFLLIRKSQVLAGLLAALIAIFGVPYVIPIVAEQKVDPEPSPAEGLFSLSERANLIVVLLDGFPGDIFEEIVAEDNDIRAAMSGFTFYPDTVGIAATTYLSLPSIHAGAQYVPGSSLRPYFVAAVREGSFMAALGEAGYDSVLVNPMLGICPNATTCVSPETILASRQTIRSEGAATLLGISLFRAAPLALKRFFYNDGRWRLPPPLKETTPISDHNVAAVTLLRRLGERMEATSEAPTAKFIHVLSPHLPVVLNSDCLYEGPMAATRQAFVGQARCALSAVAVMLAGIDRVGVAERTAVILLADHGQAISSSKADRPGPWTTLSGWANPLLAVRPAGADGPLAVSQEPRWLPQVPEIVCALTEACKIVSGWAPGTPRVFNFYEWQNEFWNADSIPVEQYRLSGPPWLEGSWSEGSLHLSD